MAKTIAYVLGVVFVIVGVLGWIPNPIVGAGALFDTNHLHDVVHLLFGLILVFVAWKAPAKSSLWLIILGVVYLVVAVLGFVLTPSGGLLLGLVQTNTTDHWLHVVLGVVLVVLGFVAKGGSKSMPMQTPPAPPAGGSMPTSNPSM